MNILTKSFSRFFEKAHPYTIAYYLGRKNTQRILDCKIKKKSKLEAQMQAEESPRESK
ncbi:hypothetical protein [Alteromonas antoniana]|uniref:hypothetical protein n=1 Tax=Alteromonas antoniana TaxID=2803813 RepID=UPI001C456D38|nr:hypothetical protein [Alteromonas antoniana]